MKYHSISIVIPLYNKEKEIVNTINSILKQDFHHYEIIIIDDGSIDQGPSLVRELNDKRISLIQTKNQGVSVARNIGFNNASYDHIAFLDADDYWNSDYLSTINSLINKYPDVGAYATGYRIRLANGKFISPRLAGFSAMPYEGIIDDYFRCVTLGDPPFFTSCICISKKVFEKIGGFPPGIKIGEDLDMWGRIALQYQIAFHANPKSIYNHKAINRTMQNCVWEEQWIFQQTAEKYIAEGNLSGGEKYFLKEYVAKTLLAAIAINLGAGKPSFAYKLFDKVDTELFKKRKYIYYLLLSLPHFGFRIGKKMKSFAKLF